MYHSLSVYLVSFQFLAIRKTYEHLYTSLFMCKDFISHEKIHQSGITDNMFLLRTCQNDFNMIFIVIHYKFPPEVSECSFQFFHILSNTCYVWTFKILLILIGLQSYFILVLIWVSLMANKPEYLFMSISDIPIFSLVKFLTGIKRFYLLKIKF